MGKLAKGILRIFNEISKSKAGRAIGGSRGESQEIVNPSK
jgi:hypothetical protein